MRWHKHCFQSVKKRPNLIMKISERIRYVGVNDCGKQLFEGIWPLPFGISYNSYLIVDQKIALVDTIDKGFEEEYLRKISKEIGNRTIDYLIVNHAEPDHSSMISLLLNIYPGILVVAAPKATPILKGFYGLTEDDILTVRDGDRLSLGKVDLTFYHTPMVHWPETMMTWLASESTLFSGDAFGTFGALNHGITDTTFKCGCPPGEHCHYSANGFHDGTADAFSMYTDEMIRYYSNIIGKYGSAVQVAIKKLSHLKINRICSTHGPIWEKQVSRVEALYERLSRYEAENGVCIAYGSMYGNTAEAARNLAQELSSIGIPVALHNLSTENLSSALRDIFRYNTLALGSPTYNGGIFPAVEAFLHAISARMLKGRNFIAFGSYSWAPASVRLMNAYADTHGFNLLHPGISFSQAYSPEKCDMKSLAETIRLALK